MRLEIVAIGEELLSGRVVNSNSAFISSLFAKIGLETMRHTVLTDNEDDMLHGLDQALERADIVITTGGLGPTIDDRTRQVAAKLFSSDFVFNEDLAKDLSLRYGPELTSIQDQATVPVKAHILKNTVGTAPGFVFESKGKFLALLPGPPLEMKTMLENELLPFLQLRLPQIEAVKHETIYVTNLTENALDPLLRELHKKYPNVDIGIYPSYGTLAIVLKSKDEESIIKVKRAIHDSFASFSYVSLSGKIEEALLDELRQKKKTLALAESCTGGLVAHRLTLIPGASDVFLGSFVVYSNDLKKSLLGVSSAALQQHGAVSQMVVQEMLEGLFTKTSADFGIAISGVAGPAGGSLDKPVGTVLIAIGQRGGNAEIKCLELFGRTREVIITLTASIALGDLFRKVKYFV